MREDRRAEGEPARIEPGRAVEAEDDIEEVVDQSPLAVKHPVDRDEGRQCRHRPGQHEDQQQRLRPPARAHEKARQQQREKQLYVDPKGQKYRSINHGVEVDRVGEHLGIQSRIAPHPQPIGGGVDDEGEEHRDIRYDERDRPGELRTLQPASPVAPQRLPPDWRAANICN